MSSAHESIDALESADVPADDADAPRCGAGAVSPRGTGSPSPGDDGHPTDGEAAGVAQTPPPAASDEAPTEPAPTDAPEAPDAASAGHEPPHSEIVAALSGFERRLGEYERLLSRHADVASRLHSENLELKKGELRQAQTSLALGVIRVVDDISRMGETVADAVRSDLLLIAEALMDALESHGVERVRVSVGDRFDGKAHKIGEVVPIESEELNRTVASVRRPGFAWIDGATIRVAEVVVYKFVPRQEPAAEADSHDAAERSAVDGAAEGPA